MGRASTSGATHRRPTAKSLVLDLLSTVPRGHPVPVGALLDAAALFGIGGNNLRVGLTRMREQGLVESNARGLYRLGTSAHPVDRRVRSWRRAEDATRRWDGSWIGAQPRGPVRRSRARRWLDTARLLGFRRFSGELWLRPDNLAGGVDDARLEWERLGVGRQNALLFGLSSFEPEADAEARALWPGAELTKEYREMRSLLEASASRLPRLSREEAMIESFLTGGEALRRIVLDPLLPDPIVDVRERRALVTAMQRYDRLGRQCWKGWSGSLIPLEHSPGDLSAHAGVTAEAADAR